MQGSMAADGTAWALRIIVGPVPQLGGSSPQARGGREEGQPVKNAAAAMMASAAAARKIRRALQRCSDDRRPWRRQGAECAEQVARVSSS